MYRRELKQMNRGDFASSSTSSAPAVVSHTVVQTPTHLTVVDAGGALIGTMRVVADGQIDAANEQVAQSNRRAGY